MEIGAFFILVIVFVVLAAGGGALYGLIAWLRHRQLDPEKDRLNGGQEDAQPRPEHVQVDTGQRARFVGTR